MICLSLILYNYTLITTCMNYWYTTINHLEIFGNITYRDGIIRLECNGLKWIKFKTSDFLEFESIGKIP